MIRRLPCQVQRAPNYEYRAPRIWRVLVCFVAFPHKTPAYQLQSINIAVGQRLVSHTFQLICLIEAESLPQHYSFPKHTDPNPLVSS